MFETQTKSFLKIIFVIFVGHLFMEEDGSGSDNLGGDCVN